MNNIYGEHITGSTVIPKELIDKVIQDERWSYTMPFFEFTKLLKYHSGMIEDPIIGIPKKDTTKKPTQESTILQCSSTILEQDEIDKLIMDLIKDD
jgi:hypothetical protein